MAPISHFANFSLSLRISHFWPQFLTFGSNFSLSFVQLNDFLTFNSEFLTFHTNFSLWSCPGMANRDLPACASLPGHANNMVVSMSLGGQAWAGPAGEVRMAGWHGSDWGRLEKWEIRWKSEKFGPKVRNSRHPANLVRNWRGKGEIGAKSEKLEASRQLSEKFEH